MRSPDSPANAREPTRDAQPERRARAPSWTSVRIEDLCVHEAASTSDLRAICAAICLPNMLPTEVVVELALLDEAGSVISGAEALRMWSEQAYDPGRFMFVARVTPEDLEQTVQATVTVRPGRRRSRRSPIRATMPLANR